MSHKKLSYRKLFSKILLQKREKVRRKEVGS